MAENYWPAVVEKADTSLRYRVKPIPAAAVDEYFSRGKRVSRKGITLYHQPKPALEVGFLIKRKAGNAVCRNRTRRLFWGTIHNLDLGFIPDRGYLFLFHNAFTATGPLYEAINGLIAQANQSRQ
ncbi:MAG: ribonuclease P protein component [Lentisphaeria bacterium]|nr:ribonuclease P protein component [Candidatus Neomarinimicrobiota bacterium]MCF7841283.1 ribonuclease P protein component [Lentisphaeria bacterium]